MIYAQIKAVTAADEVLSEVNITINILDSNDNSPTFVTSPVLFNVSESVDIGDVVGILIVSILSNTLNKLNK